MLILNKPFCKEEFTFIKKEEDIKNSHPNSTIIFNFDLNLALFCNENDINYAIITDDIKEFIFSINLNAKYVFCDDINIAKKFQKVADNYLSDTKVVLLIDSFDDIEKVIEFEIDAVRLKENK